MSCYYCGQEGHLNISEAGQCVSCNSNACSTPNGRYDEVFHGEPCAFCHLFTCERHIHPHATTTHNKGASDCFPKLTFSISGATFDASLRVLNSLIGGGSFDLQEAISPINRFVNFIYPGTAAITAASKQSTGTSSSLSQDFIPLNQESIEQSTMEMILSLSTKELSQSWSSINAQGLSIPDEFLVHEPLRGIFTILSSKGKRDLTFQDLLPIVHTTERMQFQGIIKDAIMFQFPQSTEGFTESLGRHIQL